MPHRPDPPVIEVKPPEEWAAGRPAVAVSIRRTMQQAGLVRSVRSLAVINQSDGFDCPGCAWPEPTPRHRVEFCEQGAKAVAEAADRARCSPELLADHPLADLRQRDDYWLGRQGRLTRPMIKRPDDDRYRPIAWSDAFALIGQQLQACSHPDEAVFYTSGRTSNEAAFAFQLLARSFGTNNLPDCSNLCHEPTSVALAEAIGTGKGTVTFEDFELADLVIVLGQNPGSNHPRMLSTLEAVKERGAKILAVNPLPEAGLLRFKNPQRASGLLGSGTELADLHLPVRLGGDQALFRWLSRRAIETGRTDRRFIADHTDGYESFRDAITAEGHESAVDPAEHTGVSQDSLDQAWELVAEAERIIVCWAMGITQHRDSVATLRDIANFALLTGNIGRPGAGLCPVRGHSNVQGDRTMGIWHDPAPEFLDGLSRRFAFEPPRQRGLDATDTVASLRDGRVRVIVSMGGNLARALPDSVVVEEALERCPLTVHVSTKLNRSHVVGGRTSLILPTLTRTDIDRRSGGEQLVTVEDSFGTVHASKGTIDPPDPELLSEVAIVARIGSAAVPSLQPVWSRYEHDYATIRADIEAVVDGFERFEERLAQPGGFLLANPVRDHRRFPTEQGRAQFSAERLHQPYGGGGELVLQSLRSHDQFNTTIYGHDDRYRGISGGRRVVLVNAEDITRLGFQAGDVVDIERQSSGQTRAVRSFRIVSYPTPSGCAAAYFPEANALVDHDDRSPEAGTPAFKAIPIRLVRI
jgi:molybdopterin-dependent oxidoreductase alpha subunit